MAVPTGANEVTYSFGVNPQEWTIRFTAPLVEDVGGQRAAADAALEAGADAIITYLQSTYPASTVGASRVYEGTIDGDPWPGS